MRSAAGRWPPRSSSRSASSASCAAGAPAECPDLLPYQPANYEPVGAATAEPALEGVAGPLEPAGSTSFGLARWEVYVEPGFAPAASGELLPQRIVLECGDGTFQAYQRGAE